MNCVTTCPCLPPIRHAPPAQPQNFFNDFFGKRCSWSLATTVEVSGLGGESRRQPSWSDFFGGRINNTNDSIWKLSIFASLKNSLIDFCSTNTEENDEWLICVQLKVMKTHQLNMIYQWYLHLDLALVTPINALKSRRCVLGTRSCKKGDMGHFLITLLSLLIILGYHLSIILSCVFWNILGTKSRNEMLKCDMVGSKLECQEYKKCEIIHLVLRSQIYRSYTPKA